MSTTELTAEPTQQSNAETKSAVQDGLSKNPPHPEVLATGFAADVHGIKVIFKKEFQQYFATPLACMFLSIFLFFAGICTFYLGRLFETGQADLQPFFIYHPWLYLLLVPALSMRLWAEERKSGTLELLLTLPLSEVSIVLGKFLAAWAFVGIALLLTTPLWISVNYLGEPDNGIILAGYLGSWLMAGAYLALGSFVSALCKNQIIAFVASLTLSFLFVVAGFPILVEWAAGFLPVVWVDFVANLSFYTHFMAISKGVLDFRDVAFFLISILAWLTANVLIVQGYKS